MVAALCYRDYYNSKWNGFLILEKCCIMYYVYHFSDVNTLPNLGNCYFKGEIMYIIQCTYTVHYSVQCILYSFYCSTTMYSVQ